MPKFPPAQIADFIRKQYTKHPQAAGVYMLGSAWKTLDIIGELEQTLNVPVVHPGPARCWEIQLRLGLRQPIPGYGRLLAEGTPDSPLEMVSFRNILMRVTGYEKVEGVKKLRGGAKTVASGMPDYGPVPAAMIFAHIKGLDLNGIDIAWLTTGVVPKREAVFTDHVSGLSKAGINEIR